MTEILLTEMADDDFIQFWPVFRAIIEAQETYALDADMDFARAHQLWMEAPQKTFVAKDQHHRLSGSYYLKPNAAGPGSHICNCGYMVAPEARGKGVARQMCQHSQKVAKSMGFLAMQFNTVVASNTVAVNLWKSLDYQIIGTIPKGYRHKKLGLIEAFIMYKDLAN